VAGSARRFRPHPPTSPGAAGEAETHHETVTLAQLGQALGFTVEMPASIPEGFSLQRVVLAQGARGPLGVLHFWDGVEVLNVLVFRRQDLRPSQLPAQAEGAGNAAIIERPRGSAAVAIRGQAVYTVLGPLPDDTLRRIAASIP
jgi:hypothetical protein